jgi:hypothetical protein
MRVTAERRMSNPSRLGLKRKFSFSYFHENLFSLFAKKANEKLRK